MFRHTFYIYYVNTATLTVFLFSDNGDLVYKFLFGLIYIFLIYCVKTFYFIYLCEYCLPHSIFILIMRI